MKKIIFMLALVLPMLVNAQKLGHINSQELLAAMPELKDMQAKLDTLAGITNGVNSIHGCSISFREGGLPSATHALGCFAPQQLHYTRKICRFQRLISSKCKIV